jgi:peptidoglycan/LPS O-acetylase OafA/YrhL
VKTFFVHALLLQDIIGSPTPNGAFWSIAVEAQIYVVFPLMLYLRRKRGPLYTAALVTVVTCALELLAHRVHPLARYDNLSPQLLIDFAFGMAAASSMAAVRVAGKRIPMLGISGLLCAGGLVAMNVIGSQSIVAHFFWVDVVAGVITAMAFRGIASTDRSAVKSLFQSRPMVAGGRFSYSIYLIHALVLAVISKFLVQPLHLTGLPYLAVLLALVLPGAVVTSYAFFLVFEKPFLNARSVEALEPLFDRLWMLVPRSRRPDRLTGAHERSRTAAPRGPIVTELPAAETLETR